MIQLIEIILIAPITNAILERSFSTLKRAKSSILSTMTGSRLNHLLMLVAYNEQLDIINIKLTTSKLIKMKESGISSFGIYQF